MAIEYRWAATQYDQLAALAADLVSRQVAVLFAGGGQLAVRAARAASSTIPIVFTSGADPVESGLVASLNRPEGNMTGASFFSRALAPKRLELIRELLPTAIKIAVLDNPQNPWNAIELASLKTAAAALGQQLSFLPASTVAEIDQAFVQLGRERPDALLIGTDLLFTTQRQLIVALTARHGIPAIYPSEEHARAGGLISYGAPATVAYHQAGIYVGRVLKGSNPADLPIVLPNRAAMSANDPKRKSRLFVSRCGPLDGSRSRHAPVASDRFGRLFVGYGR